MIGKHINSYRILRELRSGAMGVLYQAEDTRLHRKVALKFLPAELAESPVRRRRFERESRALAALNHPNIVTIHAIEEADGRPFLVMEWIDGQSLEDLIPPDGLPVERCIELTLSILEALTEIHRLGIVHRDLKPANVMVRDDGVLKVVDFGVSKMEPRTVADVGLSGPTHFRTEEGLTVGTLPYMSPEQLEGRPVDGRSDIFSLGVLLYEMATGIPPFHGASQASMISAILRDSAPRLRQIKGTLPARLDRIVRRCLAKSSKDRYADVEELARDLRVLQEQLGKGGEGGAPPLIERARRQPGLALIAGILVVAVVSLGAGRWWWARHNGTAPPTTPVAASAPATPAGAPLPRAATASVAVLPLRNLSDDPEEEYFSDGTTEALIANLAKVGGLRVTSRNSVMRFKNSSASLDEISAELGVNNLLEGSVMRAGSQVIIIVNLVDSRSDATLWGDTYHGSLENIFAFQRQVAEAVARKIKGELSSIDRSRLEQLQEVPPQVYELYLKGRFHQNKRTPDDLLKALDFFEQAVGQTPHYAEAWASTAHCYVALSSFGYAVMSPREAIPKAQAAARKAIGLDDNLSEAHAALAVSLFQGWKWKEAESEFRRALELNPSNADAYHQYTLFLTAMGRNREALETITRARELDPLSLIINEAVAIVHYFAGDFDQAIEGSRATLEMSPDFWLAHLVLGESYSRQGKNAEAEKEIDTALELTRRNPFALEALGQAYVRAGRLDEARKVLDELEQRARQEYVAPSALAALCFALDRLDEGFSWMDKAYAEKDSSLIYLAVHPDYGGVRADPRFQEILRKMGLDGVAPPAS